MSGPSAVFILDQKGKVIIWRNYRGEVPPSVVERFVVNVVEGERKRVQAFEGVVIAKRNRGLNSAFTVRKMSSGEGVERTFQSYSPLIASVEVKRRGDVRRAKLYYLRQRSGKAARIKERLDYVAREILPPVEAAPKPQAEAQ